MQIRRGPATVSEGRRFEQPLGLSAGEGEAASECTTCDSLLPSQETYPGVLRSTFCDDRECALEPRPPPSFPRATPVADVGLPLRSRRQRSGHEVCPCLHARDVARSLSCRHVAGARRRGPGSGAKTTGRSAGRWSIRSARESAAPRSSFCATARRVREAKSDAQGGFAFDALAEGRYQIEAARRRVPGAHDQPDVRRRPARGLAVEVSLPIGPLETAVTVTAVGHRSPAVADWRAVTVLDSSTLDVARQARRARSAAAGARASLVQAGGRGGVTSMFIRGGNSNFNKVLVDGIPANDIGGGIDLSAVLDGRRRAASRSFAKPTAWSFGSDALAGVISITSRRGQTRVPEASLSLDGGNLEHAPGVGVGRRCRPPVRLLQRIRALRRPTTTCRTTSTATRPMPADSAWPWPTTPTSAAPSDGLIRRLRIAERHELLRDAGRLVPDRQAAFHRHRQPDPDHRQVAGSVRFGLSDQRAHFGNPTLSGENIFGVGFGDTVTITGANGFSATGRGALDFGTYDVQEPVRAAGDLRSDDVSGEPGSERVRRRQLRARAGVHRARQCGSDDDPQQQRGVGGGPRHARAIASASPPGSATRTTRRTRPPIRPVLSMAAFLRTPRAAEFWSDTRLTFNAGKGIKATASPRSNARSTTCCSRRPPARPWRTSAGIGPIGPERGRNVDIGIEQGLWHGRAAGARRLLQQRVLRSRRVRQPEPAASVRHRAGRRGGRRLRRVRELAVVQGEGRGDCRSTRCSAASGFAGSYTYPRCRQSRSR